MAELAHNEGWVKVKDAEAGLQAEFPRVPIEMSFDVPFKNIPPEGHVHLYSVPTKAGILVLSSMTSKAIHSDEVNEEQLMRFFDDVLVPHLFYYPQIFKDQQEHKFTPHEVDGHSAASFQFTYLDHGVRKRMEGIAMNRGHSLIVYFYLASEKDFDSGLLRHFMDSVVIK